MDGQLEYTVIPVLSLREAVAVADPFDMDKAVSLAGDSCIANNQAS